MNDKTWKVLYLGLDPERFYTQGIVTHYPIIQIEAVPFEAPSIQAIFEKWPLYTHLLFTSRTAVKIFSDYCQRAALSYETKTLIAIGNATAQLLKKVDGVADENTAEGIIAYLDALSDLKTGHVLFPHSSLARPIIVEYLEKKGIPFTACPFYETVPHRNAPPIKIEAFDEIVFTSPSTVYAYQMLFGALPRNKKLTTLGPVTEKVVTKFFDFPYGGS